jgi:hypothetical protein
MKRRIVSVVVALILLLIGGIVSAQTSSAPVVTAFSTPLKSVDRTALTNRTARIPVSWDTANRPILANLVFEQVLPDNSIINVELPRLFPWVNSKGDGVAAPILPAGNATTIKMRVRLINLLTGANFDTKEFELPISGDGSGGSSGGGGMPTVTSFTTTFSGKINKTDLAAGAIRVPVAWTSVNRPLTATLVFEQVMPDGTIVNIELPRSTPWVNSSDRGTVAPRTPTGTTTPTEVRVRIRLVDLVYGRIYDQRDLALPIDTGNPAPGTFIQSFTTTATAVSAAGLNNGSERVVVSWNVSNRPANSNLVFEQVLADGRIRNAELPRDFLIVPSVGQGIVSLVSPGAGNSVTIRLRLVDLASNNTLDTKQISLPIQGSVGTGVIVTNDACYLTPFPPAYGLAVNKTGKVLNHANGAPIALLRDNYPATVTAGEIKTGETFTVLSGPTCVITSQTEGRTIRTWRVKATTGGAEGFIYEYGGTPTESFIRYVAATDFTGAPPPMQLVTFTIAPTQLKPDGTVTVSWEVRNGKRVQLGFGSKSFDNQPLNGTMTLNVKDILTGTNPMPFIINATDGQQNSVAQTTKIPVESVLTIKSFTATPTEVMATGNVTLNWEIEGAFTSSSITWVPRNIQPELLTAGTVTTSTGSMTLQVPLDSKGELELTLTATDPAGVTVSATTKINVTCAMTITLVADPSILPDNCAASNPESVNAAYQSFENGFMLWHKAGGAMAIGVFYNNGTYTLYGDWDGSAYEPLAENRDAPLLKPERGFGWVWTTKADVRAVLGWANGSEQGYTATEQATIRFTGADTTYNYVTLPDGRVVRYTIGQSSGNAWTFVG